jgi:bifunctional UDP-N-acetylglucosamine pyrophosphorylase/glucosamine-1-phosphate N-acetyltransferase
MSVSIIMAGGMSKRFKSETPKVLYPVFEKPMIIHIIEKCFSLHSQKIFIVVGKYEQKIKDCINNYDFDKTKIVYVKQNIANGTGGAIKECLDYIKEYESVYILSGDVPFISLNTLQNLKQNTILIAKLDNPTGNGRIINENNKIKITEEKDCNESEKLIQYINCGIYHLYIRDLVNYIPLLNTNNASNELYLTDVIQYIENVQIYLLEDIKEIYNINTLEDLENALKLF